MQPSKMMFSLHDLLAKYRTKQFTEKQFAELTQTDRFEGHFSCMASIQRFSSAKHTHLFLTPWHVK